MTLTSTDFATARALMVDGQIRPNRVSDPRIIQAMRRLPREDFLPAALAHLAYLDEDVPLGGERVLVDPLVTARMVQLAAPRAGERALVLASGTGYGAALLAACGAKVTAVEDDPALLTVARASLGAHAPGVKLLEADPRDGLPGETFDIVLIEGAVAAIPETSAGLVNRQGGRLVTVLAPPGQPGRIVLAEPSLRGLHAQPEFDANTPVLPGFRAMPAFVF